MAFEWIAGLQLIIKDVVALVPSKPLKFGWMYTLIHAGCHRASLEAMAAHKMMVVAGCGCPIFYDACYRLTVDCVAADNRRGQGAAGNPSRWRISNPPEKWPFNDRSRFLPRSQCTNRTKRRTAVGQSDHDNLSHPFAL